MCCENPMVTGSLDTGAVHDAFDSVTCSGSGSVNAPLARWPGSETLSVASPAVEVTVAVVEAVYTWSTPGVNGPKLAGPPSVSDSVAGTVPPTSPEVDVLAVPNANVCAPVTPLNSTAPLRSTALTPPSGRPSCQTTVPSMAIVRAWPSSGNTTVPDVPAGAAMVSVKDEPPSPRRQRETTSPAGVGTSPCAHARSPGCGARIHVL